MIPILVVGTLLSGATFAGDVLFEYNMRRSPSLNGNMEQSTTIRIDGREDLIFSMDTLKKATNNFHADNVIGRGGHGIVFKGDLEGRSQTLAIKKMAKMSPSTSSQISQFEREIKVLSMLNHRNVVKLMGYCSYEDQDYIIYEYVPHGPLSNHLFSPEKSGLKPLDWNQRFLIALDIAKGLEYLHNGAQHKVIHRDIKASNVLLGEKMDAKIADFGLACIVSNADDSIVHVEAAGTEGYLAPESLGLLVTTRADVFSLGVTIMELISGQRATEEIEGDRLLFRFRKALWTSNQSIETVIDPSIPPENEIIPNIVKLANVALQCTLEDPEKRIKVEYITRLLSDIISPLQMEFAPPREEDEDEYGISIMSILHNIEIENLS